jgi:ferredoxin
MEGEGPGMSGIPRPLNVILAGTDAVAVDYTVCRMLGIPSEQLLTNRIAAQMGLADGPIELQGELPRVSDFRFPDMAPLVFGPRIFHGWLRKHLIQRPATVSSTCKLCGECWKYCPAKAISHDRNRVYFDYDLCIRCYCCLEICPHGALHAEEPRFGKIFRQVVDRLTATPESASDKCCPSIHAAPR